MVLPAPGGPIINRLCIPLTATSQALFTKYCPWISEKSSICAVFATTFPISFSMYVPPFKICIISAILCTAKISISFTSSASVWFSAGTIQRVTPRSFASATIGSIPLTGFTSPLKLISPTTIVSFNASSGTIPMAQSTAATTGRSNPDPVFLILAGIKLIVIRFGGRIYPVFFSAVRTRSLDSFTSGESDPTISKSGMPSETSAST